MDFLIRRCREAELPEVHAVINDAAQAYRGVIPADCWHEPYMPLEELLEEIAAGIEFWCYEEGGRVTGVMGIQELEDVTLIRHAYVLSDQRRRGVGTTLLTELCSRARWPILMGTWRDASWAIDFYEKNGFRCLSDETSALLLRRYWNISERQIETSIVLAEEAWLSARGD
jgi:GNAT superfamily N-acetyltransferase